MISEIITTMLEAVVTMFGMLLITFVAMSPEKCEECIVKTLAKHRITDREVLEDRSGAQYHVYYDADCNDLLWDRAYSRTYGMTFTAASAKEICEKVSKDEWVKFVELAR